MEGDREKWGPPLPRDQVQDDTGFIKREAAGKGRGCFLGLSRRGCTRGRPSSAPGTSQDGIKALDPKGAARPWSLFHNYPACPLSLKTGLHVF